MFLTTLIGPESERYAVRAVNAGSDFMLYAGSKIRPFLTKKMRLPWSKGIPLGC